MASAERRVFRVSAEWTSSGGRHRDVVVSGPAPPSGLPELLQEAAANGISAEIQAGAGQWVPMPSPGRVIGFPASGFLGAPAPGVTLAPRVGRFFPGRLFSGLGHPGPVRVLAADGGTLTLDLNHPLAGRPMILRIDPEDPGSGPGIDDPAKALRDGGPGLQAPLPDRPTDFLGGHPFAREDEQDDAGFYSAPRLVHHLDAAARREVAALYGRLLAPGMRVLDLMASWESHLPGSLDAAELVGLGLNAEELSKNHRLVDFEEADLNRRPELPFAGACFDAVICTVSVEYLIRPVEVFREVRRVLRPGGRFVLTFSERWFPPKVIALWRELHPFERMGLVIAYFQAVGGWTGLNTESLRGLPRPADDKYAGTTRYSDPLYAVWGQRDG